MAYKMEGSPKKEERSLKSSRALMKSVNPAVIPRNHKVEEALQAAEEGNLLAL